MLTSYVTLLLPETSMSSGEHLGTEVLKAPCPWFLCISHIGMTSGISHPAFKQVYLAFFSSGCNIPFFLQLLGETPLTTTALKVHTHCSMWREGRPTIFLAFPLVFLWLCILSKNFFSQKCL